VSVTRGWLNLTSIQDVFTAHFICSKQYCIITINIIGSMSIAPHVVLSFIYQVSQVRRYINIHKWHNTKQIKKTLHYSIYEHTSDKQVKTLVLHGNILL